MISAGRVQEEGEKRDPDPSTRWTADPGLAPMTMALPFPALLLHPCRQVQEEGEKRDKAERNLARERDELQKLKNAREAVRFGYARRPAAPAPTL